ncbi:hypothetical protein ACFY1L_22410 [Streptomyces sp. NPDC001663]|uniref:hypothetical protein n=1 Tax=Streptomyces sp. NPDC001663 TaxID=3364597 RepID=UPI00367AFE67
MTIPGRSDQSPEPVILRVWADETGQSRFEEIRLPGGPRRSEVSTSVAWLSEKIAVRGLVWRRVEQEAPPTVPHNAPRRQLIVPLSGAVELEVSGGERRTVQPGGMILVEDTTGAGHITRAADDAPRVTLMLELGDEPFPGI